MVTAEFDNFYLISVHFEILDREWMKNSMRRLAFCDAFVDYVKKMEKKKPIIIAADTNIQTQTKSKNLGIEKPVKVAGLDEATHQKLISFGFLKHSMAPNTRAQLNDTEWQWNYYLKRGLLGIRNSSDCCTIVVASNIC